MATRALIQLSGWVWALVLQAVRQGQGRQALSTRLPASALATPRVLPPQLVFPT